MNKIEAKKQAQSNTRNVAELRNLISAARDRGGESRVNPSLSLEQALDIYERALESHPLNKVLDGMTSRYSLIITNILRDCA